MPRTLLLLVLTSLVLPVAGHAAVEAVARRVPVPIIFRAVGTIRPTTEAAVMAQASGRIMTMSVVEGQRVQPGAAIATVEDRELSLRLSQAQRGVEEAEARHQAARSAKVAALAVLAQARSEFDRTKKFLAQNAATPQQMEQVESLFRQAEAAVTGADEGIRAAEAAVSRARDAVEEVRVALGYAEVTAPFAGLVVHRLVEPGDLAWPGRPVIKLMSPDSFRLEAAVREGLAGTLSVGQELPVVIDSLDAHLSGVVDEIAPSADPATRSFTVKVRLPVEPRLLSGMFGRVDVPVGSRSAVVVPAAAVETAGQLRKVTVVTSAGPRTRMVRTGEATTEGVEILSGLREGETVLIATEGGAR